MRSRSLSDARHCPFFSRRPTLEWLDNVPRLAMLETIHFRLLTRFLVCHRSKPQGVCELVVGASAPQHQVNQSTNGSAEFTFLCNGVKFNRHTHCASVRHTRLSLGSFSLEKNATFVRHTGQLAILLAYSGNGMPFGLILADSMSCPEHPAYRFHRRPISALRSFPLLIPRPRSTNNALCILLLAPARCGYGPR